MPGELKTLPRFWWIHCERQWKHNLLAWRLRSAKWCFGATCWRYVSCVLCYWNNGSIRKKKEKSCAQSNKPLSQRRTLAEVISLVSFKKHFWKSLILEYTLATAPQQEIPTHWSLTERKWMNRDSCTASEEIQGEIKAISIRFRSFCADIDRYHRHWVDWYITGCVFPFMENDCFYWSYILLILSQHVQPQL